MCAWCAKGTLGDSAFGSGRSLPGEGGEVHPARGFTHRLWAAYPLSVSISFVASLAETPRRAALESGVERWGYLPDTWTVLAAGLRNENTSLLRTLLLLGH